MISRVQIQFDRYVGSANQVTASFSAAVTVGNSVLLIIASAAGISGVTDNKGNSYTLDQARASSGSNVSIWRSSAVATGGSGFTVTITQSGSGARPMLWMLLEVAADLVVDKKASANGGSTQPSPGALTAHATQTDSYHVFGFCAGTTSTSVTDRPDLFDAVAAARGGSEGVVSDLMDLAYDWPAGSNPPHHPIWTISPSRTWAAAIVGYVEATAPTPAGAPVIWPWGYRYQPPQPGNVLWWLHFRKSFAPPPAPEPPRTPSKPLLVPSVPSVETAAARLERAQRELAEILNSIIRQQQLVREGLGQGEFLIRGGGFAEERPPTASDDASIGARPGTVWVDRSDSTAYRVWVCGTAEPLGEAVWVELRVKSTLAASGLSGVIP